MTARTDQTSRSNKLPRPWQRCTVARPYPICHAAGCLRAGPHDSPVAVVCARVESPERIGVAGWLHDLDEAGRVWAPWRCSLPRIALLGGPHR